MLRKLAFWVSPLKVESIEATKEYISNWKSIRLFIGYGPGFGDQVCGVNILEYLMLHIGLQNKKIPVEIIVPDVDIYEKFESQTLFKVATLLGIEVTEGPKLFNSTSTSDISLSLMMLRYFQENITQEADVGIFAGAYHLLAKMFPLPYRNPDFSAFAHTKKAFSFNPFSYSDPTLDIAATLQKEGREVMAYERTQELPFLLARWNDIPPETLLKEIDIYNKINFVATHYVKKIIELKNKNAAYLFPMYGLNAYIRKFPEETVINLMLAAKRIFTNNSKPIIILLLNKFNPDNWNRLQALVTNNTSALNLNYPINFLNAVKTLGHVRFCHANNTDTCFANLNPHEFVVVSAYDVPTHLFRYLSSQINDFPSLYEGINSFYRDLTDQKLGLPCQRNYHPDLPEWSALTSVQKDMTNYLCDYRGDRFLWEEHPNLDVDLEEGIKALQQTKLEAVTDTQNRVLYMAEQMRKLEKCDTDPDQLECLWYNPTSESIKNVAVKTAAKHFCYGALEGITFFGARSLKMRKEYAAFTSSTLRMSLQAYIEDYSPVITALLLLPNFLDLSQNKSAQSAKEIFKASVLFLQLLLLIYNFDKNTFMISLLILGSAIAPDFAARKLLNKILEKNPPQQVANYVANPINPSLKRRRI